MTCHSGCGPAASASNSSSTALGAAGSSSSDSTSAGASPSSTMESSSAWSAGVGSASSSGAPGAPFFFRRRHRRRRFPSRPRSRLRLRLRLRRCYRRRPATLLPRPPWAPAPSRRSRPRRLLPYRAPGHRGPLDQWPPQSLRHQSRRLLLRFRAASRRWPSRRRTRRDRAGAGVSTLGSGLAVSKPNSSARESQPLSGSSVVIKSCVERAERWSRRHYRDVPTDWRGLERRPFLGLRVSCPRGQDARGPCGYPTMTGLSWTDSKRTRGSPGRAPSEMCVIRSPASAPKPSRSACTNSSPSGKSSRWIKSALVRLAFTTASRIRTPSAAVTRIPGK